MTYPAATHTFIQHTIDYPPPGDGWFLVQAVASVSGGSSYHPSVYDRDQSVRYTGTSSRIVGIWARPRTAEDFEREALDLMHSTLGGSFGVPDDAAMAEYGKLGERARELRRERDERWKQMSKKTEAE